MDERGFDALQQGNGPMLVLWSAVLLVAIIIAGGLWLRHMEQRAREKERKDR